MAASRLVIHGVSIELVKRSGQPGKLTTVQRRYTVPLRIRAIEARAYEGSREQSKGSQRSKAEVSKRVQQSRSKHLVRMLTLKKLERLDSDFIPIAWEVIGNA
jgi:hypothetical protein